MVMSKKTCGRRIVSGEKEKKRKKKKVARYGSGARREKKKNATLQLYGKLPANNKQSAKRTRGRAISPKGKENFGVGAGGARRQPVDCR